VAYQVFEAHLLEERPRKGKGSDVCHPDFSNDSIELTEGNSQGTKEAGTRFYLI
jgi:hypothetical protein